MRLLTLVGLVATIASGAVKADPLAEFHKLEESGLISTRTYEVTRGVHIVAADDVDDNPVAYFVIREDDHASTDTPELVKKSAGIILDPRDVPMDTILSRDITLHPALHDDNYDPKAPLSARDLIRRVKRPTNPAGRRAKCGGFCSLKDTCPRGCRHCTIHGNRNGSGLPANTKRCMREVFPPGHPGNNPPAPVPIQGHA